MSAERVAHIVNLAQGWVEQGITPALVVLVARKGVVVIHEAFGRLGPEPDAPPLAKDTIFPLASLSKPITATAAMILVEDGRLGLNRPVQWYVPEFVGEAKDAIMVHHLLTHTSGISDESVEPRDMNAFPEKRPRIPPPDETEHPFLHDWLWLRYDVPLWKTPGTEMSYCTFNYELLGEIVRRVSGLPFADFCQQRIFEPLGMTDTSFLIPHASKGRMVRRSPDAPRFIPMHLLEMPWPSGGAVSTAADLAVFGQMFLDGGTYGDTRILSPASVAEMTRNQIPGISAQYDELVFAEASWGYGWSARQGKNSIGYAEPLQSQGTFSHGGAGGTFVWVDPAYDLVGIYLSVASEGGIPADVCLPERSGYSEMIGRVDLLINAVTAAVTDL
jgi:CubicO group peptidase (beta-lactamase class C family)